MDWILMAQDRNRWRAVLNTATNFHRRRDISWLTEVLSVLLSSLGLCYVQLFCLKKVFLFKITLVMNSIIVYVDGIQEPIKLFRNKFLRLNKLMFVQSSFEPHNILLRPILIILSSHLLLYAQNGRLQRCLLTKFL